MNQFKVFGVVPKLKPNCKEFRLKADNGSELEAFFISENIDTKLVYSGEIPFIKVRGKLAQLCHEGDEVCHTIETHKTKAGKRIRGVEIKVL
jgi:hypothetical protein